MRETGSMQKTAWGYHALRLALGAIYVHFGSLKFLPGASPAESIAGQTIEALTGGLLSPATALLVLAVIECGLGLAFLLNQFPRAAFLVFLLHMVGTFTPFVVLPEIAFVGTPLTPTLEGQYILKNTVFVVAVVAVFVPALFGQEATIASPKFHRNSSRSAEPATLLNQPTT